MESSVEQARQFANAGDLDRAITLCTGRLRTSPDDPDALHLLGVLRNATGDPDTAVALIRRAIELDGGSAKHFLNLGIALKARGNLDQAIAALQCATDMDPSFDEAHFNFAVLLQAQGKWPDAVARYRQTIVVNPDHADAWHNLAIALRRLGLPGESIDAGKRAVELNPQSPEVMFSLGLSHKANDDPARAAASFENALQMGGEFPQVYKALGDVQVQLGHYRQAIDALERAARLAPEFMESIGDLAYRLESKTRLDDARIAVDRGLAIKPDDALLRLVAAKLARRSNQPEAGIRQLDGIDLPGLKPALAGAILHESGLLHDRLGDSTRAFECFTDANRLQLQVPENYTEDGATFLQFVEAWRKDFTREWVASCRPIEIETNPGSPVFIVGFPRSGTTLLDQIMDSHPRLKTLEEKPLIKNLTDDINGLRNPGESFPGTLARIDTAQATDLRNRYLGYASSYTELQPGEILVDKLPLNIVRVPLIWRIFPDARFVFALRDPRDVCLSCFMQYFEANAAMSSFTNLEQTAHLYNRVMDLWLHYTKILPIAWHRVRYEDMVTDTRQEIQHLLDFLGLEWDERMLQFHKHAKNRTRIDTPSYHQVTEPIYKRAAQRWRRYESQLEPVTGTLAPFINTFGYDA